MYHSLSNHVLAHVVMYWSWNAKLILVLKVQFIAINCDYCPQRYIQTSWRSKESCFFVTYSSKKHGLPVEMGTFSFSGCTIIFSVCAFTPNRNSTSNRIVARVLVMKQSRQATNKQGASLSSTSHTISTIPTLKVKHQALMLQMSSLKCWWISVKSVDIVPSKLLCGRAAFQEKDAFQNVQH